MTKRQRRILWRTFRYTRTHPRGYWPEWESVELAICDRLATRGYLDRGWCWNYILTAKGYAAIGVQP